MRVALAGTYPEGTAERFREALPSAQFEVMEIDTPEKYEELTQADCMILRIFKATAEDMGRIKGLKMISRWGAGYDSVDTEEASRRGILVTNTPGANAYAVSEHTVLLMLAVCHNLLEHTESLQKGIWSKTLFMQQAKTLNNRTVGLIGGGNIGRQVARKVEAFGAKVRYYDKYRLSREVEQEYQMEYVPFDELIRSCDIISLHIPMTQENYHLIGETEFSKMKRGAIVVNTARGGLLDEAALLRALEQGIVAGAGLDCVEHEPLKEADPLISHPHIVVTPHVGGVASDISEAMIPMLVQNILDLASGAPVQHVVNC